MRDATASPAPQISVIIPTYNYAHFLAAAIDSILKQTRTDFEVIVVDDGSTDSTKEVALSFGDPRIRYLHQANQGGAAARNTGIRNSKGDFLAFLDADDYWLPQKLERQMQVMIDYPDVDVVYCGAILEHLDNSGRPTNRRVLSNSGFQESSLYEQLLYLNVITGSGSSVMLRARTLVRVGLFDEKLRIADIDMWRRLSYEHSFCEIQDPLVCIRRHTESTTSKVGLMADEHVRYIQKLKKETPAEFQHHIPRVSMQRYFSLAYLQFQKREVAGGFLLTLRLMGVVLRHPIVFFQVVQRLGFPSSTERFDKIRGLQRIKDAGCPELDA